MDEDEDAATLQLPGGVAPWATAAEASGGEPVASSASGSEAPAAPAPAAAEPPVRRKLLAVPETVASVAETAFLGRPPMPPPEGLPPPEPAAATRSPPASEAVEPPVVPVASPEAPALASGRAELPSAAAAIAEMMELDKVADDAASGAGPSEPARSSEPRIAAPASVAPEAEVFSPTSRAAPKAAEGRKRAAEDTEPSPPPRRRIETPPVRWEFSVKDGFQAFEAKCQAAVEELYQDFKSGKLVGKGRAQLSEHQFVLLDFVTMTQQVEGSTRTRKLRRVEVPAPSRSAVPAGSSARWEFSVKDGFKAFEEDCQEPLEAQYQAFLTGGEALGRVEPKGGAGAGLVILVDFKTMKQRVEGSARERTVRRSLVPAAAAAGSRGGGRVPPS